MTVETGPRIRDIDPDSTLSYAVDLAISTRALELGKFSGTGEPIGLSTEELQHEVNSTRVVVQGLGEEGRVLFNHALFLLRGLFPVEEKGEEKARY